MTLLETLNDQLDKGGNVTVRLSATRRIAVTPHDRAHWRYHGHEIFKTDTTGATLFLFSADAAGSPLYAPIGGRIAPTVIITYQPERPAQ